mgnify:FL=1|tara:strand:- start:69322 stop:69435 length:114 start_codon:yes stop_codon:yes gene_type:complete
MVDLLEWHLADELNIKIREYKINQILDERNKEETEEI